jgi:coenzyme F420-reducing hydrogenase gamma subunit
MLQRTKGALAPEGRVPRVVLVGFASCFGCQINITNAEAHLTEILGQIDMRYWQLTQSEPMPDEFDVAVIEGAITTREAEAAARELRCRAKAVITIGACANTAGIPGMAAAEYDQRAAQVYGQHVPEVVAAVAYAPRAVADVIDVDFEVPCCPADPFDFVRVLQKALYGSNPYEPTSTLCGQCKRNERGCFFAQGTLCLGLVTRSGCGARCTNLGRACNGCAGLSPDANVESARRHAVRVGIDAARFDAALEMFNQINPVLAHGDKNGECVTSDTFDTATTTTKEGA